MSLLTIDRNDIDVGATPVRTNKRIAIKVRTIQKFEDNDIVIGGRFIEIKGIVAIDIYVRDIKAVAEAREPTDIIELEKYIVNFITTNKLAFQDEGISHVTIRNVTTPILMDEWPTKGKGDTVWFRETIFMDMYYWLRTDTT